MIGGQGTGQSGCIGYFDENRHERQPPEGGELDEETDCVSHPVDAARSGPRVLRVDGATRTWIPALAPPGLRNGGGATLRCTDARR